MQKSLLVVIRGLPGSGKSTIMDHCIKKLDSAVRLDPDKINLESDDFVSFCQGRHLSVSLEKRMYRFLLYQACSSLQNKQVVIWEQPWRQFRLFLLTLENIAIIAYNIASPDFSNLPFSVKVVEFVIDQNIAQQRVSRRFEEGKHCLTPAQFSQFLDSLEPFDPLFPTLTVDGTEDIEVLCKKVYDFLTQE